MRIPASANTDDEGVEHWGLTAQPLSFALQPQDVHAVDGQGQGWRALRAPTLRRAEGWGFVPAASETPWAKGPLCPARHKPIKWPVMFCRGYFRIRGREAQTSVSRASFPSPQLTLALNSTDLISWWWEKAKHARPSGPFALVL